eukprot:TRINITY_DN19587_c0_g1_i1.p1 TRINITY_DN19587_c0_g1~~TRINITY_DN19587_c0_g1_i1.p1  ORF type:complete len:366 (+),score=108.25 TRINITY_DN19587_c0_g1_i1:83-1180(+)
MTRSPRGPGGSPKKRSKKQLSTALFNAVRAGDAQQARQLLDGGANVDYKGGMFAERPLHVAASKGNLEVARLLVAYGADVTARCERRNTPLHEAVEGHSPAVVMLLVDGGAEIHAKNKTGVDPLGLAKRKALKQNASDVRKTQALQEIIAYLKGPGISSNTSRTSLPGPPSEAPTKGSSGRRPRPAPAPPASTHAHASAAEAKALWFAKWLQGCRQGSGALTWESVRAELEATEELCRALRASQGMEYGAGPCDPMTLLPDLLPDTSVADIAAAVSATTPTPLSCDPLGWVSVTFPTPDAQRAAWTACSNPAVGRILDANMRLLAPPPAFTAATPEASQVEVSACDTASDISESMSPPAGAPPVR